MGFSVVLAEEDSGQAGNANAGTISCFFCAIETGWNRWISGPADPNSPGTSNGADISTSAGRETTSGSGFWQNFGPPAYVTEGP